MNNLATGSEQYPAGLRRSVRHAGAVFFMVFTAGCGDDRVSLTAPSPIDQTMVATTQRPVVTGVAFDNRPQSGDAYRVSEQISVRIILSEPVNVTGRPRLALTIGTTTRQATASDDPTLTDSRFFHYTVQKDDRDEDGIAIDANALSLNGGTIRSASGEDAVLDLGVHVIRDDPERKVDGSSQGGGENGTCRLPLQGDGYTICYEGGYRADAEFVRDVLNPATSRFRTRYGPSSTRVYVHLLAEPATVGSVMVRPGQAVAVGGLSQRAIYLMARSAPAMQGACCNGIGLQFTDIGYQRTVLVHEYSTVFQQHHSGYRKWAGWFVQGLQQYEGLTAAGSPDLWQRTAERVYRDNTVSCGSGSGGAEELVVSERYWAGALVLRFLADRFGESAHIRILRSSRSTLREAIADEQPPGETPCELFDRFRNWMHETYGLGQPVESVQYTPQVACTGQYWQRNDGTFSFEVRVLNNDRRPARHQLFQQQHRSDSSRSWTSPRGLTTLPTTRDSSGFANALFTGPSSAPFQWRARSCPSEAQTDDLCSNWSNTINWTAASCAATRSR